MTKPIRHVYRETREGAPEASPTFERPEPLRLAPHGPECMEVFKVSRRGQLIKHTIRFYHDCGDTEVITQEELPW